MLVVLKQTTFHPQQTTLASSIRMEYALACHFLLEYTLLYPPLSEYIRTVLTPVISTTGPAERAKRNGVDLSS